MRFIRKVLDAAGEILSTISKNAAESQPRVIEQPRPQAVDTAGCPDPTRTDSGLPEDLPQSTGATTSGIGSPQVWCPGQTTSRRLKATDELGLIPQSIKEARSPWRALWLAQLACQASPEAAAEVFPSRAADDRLMAQETKHLVDMVYGALDAFTDELNLLLDSAPLRITTTNPAAYCEKPGSDGSERGPAKAKTTSYYYRFRSSTASWSLSVRGASGVVEIFLIPGSEVMLLSRAEFESRQKARLTFSHNAKGSWWTRHGLPVDDIELKVLVRTALKELMLRSVRADWQDADTLDQLLNLEDDQLKQAVRLLMTEKQNLVQKIVAQQEEIQTSIARDLHDAVIADVMLLKRSLSEHKNLSSHEINTVLDRIARQLRDICNDLSPRDLMDWGLQPLIEDMLDRVAKRTGADCALTCENELPDLPNAVQLHIFRMIQECLNNIEKYSGAQRVRISIDVTGGIFRITIEDNGKGFSLGTSDRRPCREGGRGMSSLRERVELIRAFYPASLSIESAPDSGSKMTLEITVSGGFGAV